MTYFRILFILSIFLPIAGFSQAEGEVSSPPSYDKIFELHRQMENSWKEDDMRGIAAYYDTDGYLLNPSEVVASGENDIIAYWEKMKGKAVSWRLEEQFMSTSLEEMLGSEPWKALKEKPPLWEQFEVSLDDKGTYYFDLGISHLTYTSEGEEHTSVVTYLMVLEQKEDGSLKIQIDTYN
ncbi:MAG: hypothetical protein AAF824_15400 [Bacteroidota bacterium]